MQTGATSGDLVLIVDDDPEIRQLAGAFLAQHGFRIAEAGDGVAMDRALAAERPALVVLDLMLPGEDGLALCRRLAAARVPVIMLSALGEDTDRIVGLELGADDYLPKPCNPRELLARVRAVLRRRGGHAPEPAGGARAGEPSPASRPPCRPASSACSARSWNGRNACSRATSCSTPRAAPAPRCSTGRSTCR